MNLRYFVKKIATNDSEKYTVPLDNGLTELEIYYDATFELVGLAINTTSGTGSYMFSVYKGFWTHLGIIWDNDKETIGIHK